MAKTIIYIVAAGVLALIGFDGYLAATAQASAHTIIELVVGAGAILAFAIAAFIKTVSGSTSWGICWPKRGWKAEVNAKLSGLNSLELDLESLKSKYETVDAQCDELTARLDALDTIDSTGPEPESWVATINTKDGNGKLVKVYDLPPEDTRDEAIEAARGSLVARECEGNPVEDARITLTPVYGA